MAPSVPHAARGRTRHETAPAEPRRTAAPYSDYGPVTLVFVQGDTQVDLGTVEVADDDTLTLDVTIPETAEPGAARIDYVKSETVDGAAGQYEGTSITVK